VLLHRIGCIPHFYLFVRLGETSCLNLLPWRWREHVLRIVSSHVSNYTISWPRRPESKYPPLWKLFIDFLCSLCYFTLISLMNHKKTINSKILVTAVTSFIWTPRQLFLRVTMMQETSFCRWFNSVLVIWQFPYKFNLYEYVFLSDLELSVVLVRILFVFRHIITTIHLHELEKSRVWHWGRFSASTSVFP
jgi:hypothetical protein